MQTRAAMELFQLANEGAEISTAASVMFAITLVVRPPAPWRVLLTDVRSSSAGAWLRALARGRGCAALAELADLARPCAQGLAVGFVLLRVEALVEEGDI